MATTKPGKMGKPEKSISVAEARELQENWKSTRGKAIEAELGHRDTREFWYSLDELQEYLEYVRDQSRKQGVTHLGLRIYFGAYPKKDVRQGNSTLFLAPTKRTIKEDGEEEDENNYEIDPLNDSQGGWPPINY